MNAIRFRLRFLALACAAASLIFTFGPHRRIAEARRSEAPSPDPTISSAISPEPAASTSDPTTSPGFSPEPSTPSSDPATAAGLSPDPATQPSPQASDQAGSSDPASPSASPEGRRRHARSASSPVPSPTPTSPAFSSLDGYWEVVVQTSSENFYSRFDLHQSADALTGVWTRDGKRLPMEGTYGGRQFKLVAKNDAQTLTLTGYVENASDMVGIVDDEAGKTRTAFTASHHAAYRTNNVLPKRGEKRGS